MYLPVSPPEGALRGEVRATLATSLTDGQGSLREHMRAYPYTCLEQRVARAASRAERAPPSVVLDVLLPPPTA
jgi:hypothetical protein